MTLLRLLLPCWLLAAPLLAHPDHSLRHWEQASPDPDRIVLTWAGDPSTSQAVTWQHDLGEERTMQP